MRGQIVDQTGGVDGFRSADRGAAGARGRRSPTSSPVDSSTRQGKKAKRSSLDDTTSTAAYRTAYETIYDRNDYSKPPRWRTAGRRPRLLTVPVKPKGRAIRHALFLLARLP
jgi:hypothetical protein